MSRPPANTKVDDFVSRDEIGALIARARHEDLGPGSLDITSAVFIPRDRPTVAVMHARKPGRLAGAALLEMVAQAYDWGIRVEPAATDGSVLAAGQTIATFRGSLCGILAMERVALNFATHLSGIATLTAQYVEAVAGTKANIYDTRKTIPGLRGLAKYAVACGGGHNHRIGLYDAVLVKDNHIAHVASEALAAALKEAIARARAWEPVERPPRFIEVEVDTLDQLRRVLTCDVDVVLLDNMSPGQMREAVAMRNAAAPRVELEASGGVHLGNVRAIADTGVERIAIGALTHSAPALDLGLDID